MSGSKWLVIAMACAAACDLEPAPKKRAEQAAASTSTSTSTSTTPTPSQATGSGSDVSDACMAVGVHFADVWINEAQNAQDRATLEQERTLMVRRTALACTKAGWTEDARACVVNAKTRAEVSACQKKTAEGSGSAQR